MPTLRLDLFGLPRIGRDGVTVSVARRKALALLAYLALSPNPLSRDFLAELHWPERAPSTARADLRTTLHAIRAMIGPEWLDARSESVALQRGPGLVVDVLRFRELLAQAATHAHAPAPRCDACAATLAEAIALYRGDFLAGFTLRDAPEFDNWQTYQTESLRLELAGALERLAWLEAAGGDYEAAIGYGRRWLELDPLCEEPHRALMRLHTQAGNRAAALHQYEECARVLAVELGVKPDVETTALRDAVAGGAVQAHPALTQRQPPLALPADRTPFIGRASELAQITRYLTNPGCRLLTVLGPGGIGKTRLAVTAARRQAGQYPDGIFFVDLQPVAQAELLAPVLLQALSIPLEGPTDPGDQLAEALSERVMLLVLDNIEHLIAGSTLISRVLDKAPGVKILVTSRTRLNLVEEWLLPLAGLSLPSEQPTSGALGMFDATALFLATLSRLQPEYRPGPREATEITHVCRLLEGMPLAIELAAARTRVMPVADIAAGLSHGLDVLTTTMRDMPARHRSMTAAFDGSWRLLSPRERNILRQASVFRGGFTTEAAGAVMGATLADLEGLMDSCWLRVETGGRWGMHELIRQYCENKLKMEHEEDTGENADAVKARHIAYFRFFVVEKHVALQKRPEALPEIEPELGNLLAAWEGFANPDDLAQMHLVTAGVGVMADRLLWWPTLLPIVEQSIRRLRTQLAAGVDDAARRRRLELALAWFLFLTTEGKQAAGRYSDSPQVLAEAKNLLGAGDLDDLDWAQTHYMIVRNQAWAHYLMGEWAAADRNWQDALAQIHRARFPVWVFPPYSALPAQAEILLGLAWGALESGRYDEGLAWAQEAVDMAVEFDSPQYEAFMRTVWIAALTATGEYHRAERVARQTLHQAHSRGSTHIVLQCLPPLADLYLQMGRPDSARIWARRCVALCEETGFCESVLPWALRTLAAAELELGHVPEARRHALRNLQILEQTGGLNASPYADAALMMGWVALAAHEHDAAETWVRRALASPAKRMYAEAGALRLLATIRRMQGSPEVSTEILACIAQNIPLSHSGRQKVTKALDVLEAEMLPAAYAAAVARGQTRNPDALVAELLAGPAQASAHG